MLLSSNRWQAFHTDQPSHCTCEICSQDTLRFLLAALAGSLRLCAKLALRAQTCARLRARVQLPTEALLSSFACISSHFVMLYCAVELLWWIRYHLLLFPEDIFFGKSLARCEGAVSLPCHNKKVVGTLTI